MEQASQTNPSSLPPTPFDWQVTSRKIQCGDITPKRKKYTRISKISRMFNLRCYASQIAKPARLLWRSGGKKKKKKPSEGCKVASWTHFHSCLHASLCSLFPSYRPQLTGWCNSQQAHSSGSPHLPPLFPLSPLFPPSLSSPLLLPPPNLFSSHPPSPLPFSPICHAVLCHFFFLLPLSFPYFPPSLSLPDPSLYLFLSSRRINSSLRFLLLSHLTFYSVVFSSHSTLPPFSPLPFFLPPSLPSFPIPLSSFLLSFFNSCSLSLCFSL